MKHLLLLITIILYPFLPAWSRDVSILNYPPSDKVPFDTIPYMVHDESFVNSLNELINMFDGNIPYNLKRAEYLVENAYFNGKLNYNDFSHEIDSVVDILNRYIDVNNIRNYRTAPNYALFQFFTKPSSMNGNLRFSYDLEDPYGKKDYTIFFTSHLLRTHKGQCTTMPLLYKILCDELGGQSALAMGPRHLYIKHLDENGAWTNVELTHGGLVRDIWMIESMNISTEAIRNGIFLCAFNEQETIALMIMQLAKAYYAKYISYDAFVLLCAESVLDFLPTFSNALVLKLNVHYYQFNKYLERYGESESEFLKSNYLDYRKTLHFLDTLGYSQPTVEEYNDIIIKNQQESEALKNE